MLYGDCVVEVWRMGSFDRGCDALGCPAAKVGSCPGSVGIV